MIHTWNRWWVVGLGRLLGRPVPDALPLPGSRLGVGTLVRPAADLAGVPGPDGTLIAAERLGYGVVRECLPDRPVCVTWPELEITFWLDAQDLCPLDPRARLIRVLSRDQTGCRTPLRQRIGLLEQHWTVELLPNGIVRALGEDGQAWTFKTNPLERELIGPWLEPPTDEDAEALTAAELALAF